MSDAVLVGLITGGVGVAGLALNVWSQTQERKQRLVERQEERDEWYRRTLFERRLDALRQEYAWIMKLHRLRTRLEFRSEGATEELRQGAREARDWYDENALLLYEEVPVSSEFVGFVNAAVDDESRGYGKQLDDALESHRSRVRLFMTREARL